MSSPNHPTSNIEDAFSSNFPDYIPASPDYVPASPGNNDDSFPNHQQVEPRRSTRQRRQRAFGPYFEMYLVEGDRKGLIREYPIIYNLDEDPQAYSKAMKSHDSSFWKEAVNDEMDSIIGNNTWILVDLPPGLKAIKSKRIFKRKLRVDGSIEKFKARILIALASINKLIIHQMDVKTAFLNGELEEEVYMEQPEDDMLIFGTDLEQVQITKKLLSENFDMKDLGEADVIIGIKILRKENRLMLTQSHYIENILKRFDSFNCFLVSTLFEVGSKLTYNTSRILAQNKYAKVIGSLMKTMNYGLEYSRDPSVLEGYTNASWITDQEDYVSTSKWIFTLSGGAVSWGLKKQSCLTDFTIAAEFVALASCYK
ncbi:retrovirus-related pol polyprotein from transposon TNT 1-94 [Tanacetum coccineum]